jgi:hypothetical protein
MPCRSAGAKASVVDADAAAAHGAGNRGVVHLDEVVTLDPPAPPDSGRSPDFFPP